MGEKKKKENTSYIIQVCEALTVQQWHQQIKL